MFNKKTIYLIAFWFIPLWLLGHYLPTWLFLLALTIPFSYQWLLRIAFFVVQDAAFRAFVLGNEKWHRRLFKLCQWIGKHCGIVLREETPDEKKPGDIEP